VNPEVIYCDVSNLAYRSHFALNGLSWDGKPTAMLHGFLSTVFRLKQRFDLPIVFCWDYGLPGDIRIPSWRSRVFHGYKARFASDDRRIVQQMLPELYKVLDYMGLLSIGVPGFEADDIISLLCCRKKISAYVFTTDRDLYQVLDGERIHILNPKKEAGSYQVLREAHVKAQYGISVARWPTYLALGGDQSDGIHVMKGVGPKTALKMVAMGIDLERAWESQDGEIRKKFKRCGECWKDLQAAFQVAKLPTDWDDVRIREQRAYRDRVGDMGPPKNVAAFNSFCLQYGLSQLMVKRELFF
jgi:5'-3' exonuclease